MLTSLAVTQLEQAGHEVFNIKRKTQRNISGPKTRTLFQQPKVWSQKDSSLKVHFESFRRWKVPKFFSHTNPKPCWIDTNLCAPRRI